MKKNCPNYHAIYADLIAYKKGKEKSNEYSFLETFKFNSALDVLEFNNVLFPNENGNTVLANQKLRSYTIDDISTILKLKKSQNLTLKEVSNKYKISKTTLLKWMRLFENKVFA